MKKHILKKNICIDEIEKIIAKNKKWDIIDKKYDFYQSYFIVFDNLNYEAKVDLYIYHLKLTMILFIIFIVIF